MAPWLPAWALPRYLCRQQRISHVATVRRACRILVGVDAAIWKSRGVPAARLSVERYQQSKPRFLSSCGYGPLVYARVPVTDRICGVYRDGDILVQLQYDHNDRLVRTVADMAPYKSLPVPLTGITFHWAR